MTDVEIFLLGVAIGLVVRPYLDVAYTIINNAWKKNKGD